MILAVVAWFIGPDGLDHAPMLTEAIALDVVVVLALAVITYLLVTTFRLPVTGE